MKILKTSILSVGVVVMLMSCHSRERAQLRHQVDSLNTVVQASKKVEDSMLEVGLLIDSIDANRMALNAKMIEGTTYADYVSRLRNINAHIQETQKKLDLLEESTRTAGKVSTATIQRLKTDLSLRQNEIVALQIEVANIREENRSLAVRLDKKDSVLSAREKDIQVKEGDIANLQGLAKDVYQQNRIKVADLYFAQAQALETAAHRTRFAPHKKKETKREALELYKLSLSMGKAEAQEKIDLLEKDLS